jgi:hypothetical protein
VEIGWKNYSVFSNLLLLAAPRILWVGLETQPKVAFNPINLGRVFFFWWHKKKKTFFLVSDNFRESCQRSSKNLLKTFRWRCSDIVLIIVPISNTHKNESHVFQPQHCNVCKGLKPCTLAEFEPTIFCSVCGRDDRYATSPELNTCTYIYIFKSKLFWGSGVDDVITIFYDFRQFPKKKLAFFSKKTKQCYGQMFALFSFRLSKSIVFCQFFDKKIFFKS